MFKKLLTSFILSFFTINIFAVNLIVLDGLYQGLCAAGNEAILKEARANAYSKLVGDREEYEQISKWREEVLLGPAPENCNGYVSASFVKKAEDSGERFVQAEGIAWLGVDNYDFGWDAAKFKSLKNAKFYCNNDYDPEFLKTVSTNYFPFGYGSAVYRLTADYKC